MKRDLDLVRKILLLCEEHPSGYAPTLGVVDLFTDEQVGFHVALMIEAGLLGGKVVHPFGSGETGPMGIASNLTWTGYEFLEAARDEGTWQTAKGAAAKGAGMTFAAVLAGLVALATDQVKQRLGLPPGH